MGETVTSNEAALIVCNVAQHGNFKRLVVPPDTATSGTRARMGTRQKAPMSVESITDQEDTATSLADQFWWAPSASCNWC